MAQTETTSRKTGKCLCGAVRFVSDKVPSTAGICHCEQCRRWTGLALMGVTIPTDTITWEGAEHIGRIQSSEWAERAWCTKCGTGLFYRVTADNEWSGGTEIPVGLFDDPNGFELKNEIFIDQKPDGFAFAGDGRKEMTRADCIKLFSQLDSE
ncbi:GFA family protein [Shimia sp.]|uniref:GFA family protein n=1 Tax=Shimia sp. TaxID=1954381 RepID=UPI003B8DF2A5